MEVPVSTAMPVRNAIKVGCEFACRKGTDLAVSRQMLAKTIMIEDLHLKILSTLSSLSTMGSSH